MDPRNTAVTAPIDLDWSEPPAEETAIARKAIDEHRTGQYERIEMAVDEHGCEVITDRTGEFEAITVACPEDFE